MTAGLLLERASARNPEEANHNLHVMLLGHNLDLTLQAQTTVSVIAPLAGNAKAPCTVPPFQSDIPRRSSWASGARLRRARTNRMARAKRQARLQRKQKSSGAKREGSLARENSCRSRREKGYRSKQQNFRANQQAWC